MESLHKLDKNTDYELLLVDESEACFKQFNSSTMTRQNDVLWKNFHMLNSFREVENEGLFRCLSF